MLYSAIGILALLILLIENQDILMNRKGGFGAPAWKIYRYFLFAVIDYYIVIACGTARYTEKDDSIAAVFERADAAMYENKRILKKESGTAEE